MGTNTLQSRLSLFSSTTTGCCCSLSTHARSYLLLTAAHFCSKVDLHNIKVHNACHCHLPSASCSLPESASVLCPSGLFLDNQDPGITSFGSAAGELGHHCPASASDIPLSARGSALHCSIGDIFKTQRGIPYQPGYGRGYSGKPLTQSREPMASRGRPGQPAQGDQQLMAPRWKWHRPASAFSWQQPRCREVGKTKDALCHSTSIWMDSGFWILRGSPDALSSRKTSQIPPCTSCLRKKAARPLAGHPLDAGPLSALDLHTAGFSLSVGPGTRSRRRSLGLEKDWQPFTIQSEQPTCRNPGRSPSMELCMPNRGRAQEWPKMMSTCTPDSSSGFLKSRHLENINSSNPNALNTDASDGLHKLH